MAEKDKTAAVANQKPTESERFTNLVVREFGATIGDSLEMTPYQKRLAQHLFIKIDAQLKELEAKRAKQSNSDKKPIVWENVNMNKLAIDAVHRVDLGLDALIPNHIHPIPYWNSKVNGYDLDLRVGYVGKDYYRRRVAMDEPVDIIYELKYSTDKFIPLKKNANRTVEDYEFEITKPFARGEVEGGFGYIIYTDPTKNKLVLVTPKNFERSKKAAKTMDFWSTDPEAMQYKCIVHRTTNQLIIDPKKVNESFLQVEIDDADNQIEAEVEESANQKVIDIKTTALSEQEFIPNQMQQAVDQSGDPSEKERAEILAAEQAEDKPDF